MMYKNEKHTVISKDLGLDDCTKRHDDNDVQLISKLESSKIYNVDDEEDSK